MDCLVVSLQADSSGAVVLVADPAYVCFGPTHLPAALLAMAVLLLHVIGFPLATFLYLKRKTRTGLTVKTNSVRSAVFGRGLGHEVVFG